MDVSSPSSSAFGSSSSLDAASGHGGTASGQGQPASAWQAPSDAGSGHDDASASGEGQPASGLGQQPLNERRICCQPSLVVVAMASRDTMTLLPHVLETIFHLLYVEHRTGNIEYSPLALAAASRTTRAQLGRIDKDAAYATFRRLTGNGHGHWDPAKVLHQHRARVQTGGRWLAFRLMQSVYRVDSSTAAMLPSFVTRDSFLLKPPLRKQLIRSHFEVVLVRFV